MDIEIKKGLNNNKCIFSFLGEDFVFTTYGMDDSLLYMGRIPFEDIEFEFKTVRFFIVKEYRIYWKDNKHEKLYSHSVGKKHFDILKEKIEGQIDYLKKNHNNKLILKQKESELENERLVNLENSKNSILNQFDKDGNGKVDLVNGNDFNLLLRKHQNKVTEIDRSYIQEFVKISSYIKSKKENIQKIFDSIKDTPNEETLNNYVQILKDDIHSYNLLLFNSLNMIVSLVEDDMITFYEIHERFDNLNIFDSKHERDVSLKLSNIGDGLKELMFSIEEMGRNIEDQLSDLSYVTQQSSQSLNSQLEQIDSSLKTNNLLTTINTYQTYKLRD